MSQRPQQQHDDDDVEDVPIPLDRETIERLARFGRAVGRHPRDVAGALLRDLLIDDELAHQPLN